MNRWTAARMSFPCGVPEETTAPTTRTSKMTVTPIMRQRLGALTRATEKLWPRGRERPRLDDTIFLPEGRPRKPTITWKFLMRIPNASVRRSLLSLAAQDVTVLHYRFAAKQPIRRHNAAFGHVKWVCARPARRVTGQRGIA